jgi:hypothetical protein
MGWKTPRWKLVEKMTTMNTLGKHHPVYFADDVLGFVQHSHQS